MRKIIFVCFLLTVAIASLSSNALAQSSAQSKADALLALKGLDPVLLSQGKEAKGEETLSLTHKGFKYLFANAEDKARFEKEPKRFEIQLSGECPVVPGAEGNPGIFTVYNERIYIFASDDCLANFKQDPKKYVNP
jgi:YHS domain-containing protein